MAFGPRARKGSADGSEMRLLTADLWHVEMAGCARQRVAVCVDVSLGRVRYSTFQSAAPTLGFLLKSDNSSWYGVPLSRMGYAESGASQADVLS
jgi:hypothetical protein